MPDDLKLEGSIADIRGALEDNESDVKDTEEINIDDKSSEEKDEDILDKDDDSETKDEDDDNEDNEVKEDILEDETEFHSLPSRKEILAKYPNLYKDFPALQKAVYREEQYAEVFPTLDDARNARDEVNNFRQLEGSLLKGSSEVLLKNLKQNAPDAFNKINDSYLETLSQVDEKAYRSIIDKVVKGTLHNVLVYAKNKGNENGEKAAQIIHDLIYGTTNVTVPEKVEPKEDKDKRELEEQRAKFQQEKIVYAVNDVSDRAKNLIKAAIDKHIDPKEQMSTYVRSKAADDAYREVEQLIIGDRKFRAHLDKLWANAIAEAGNGPITEASKLTIRNAIISRARQTLPRTITNIRGNALKGTRRREQEKDEAPLPRGRDLAHKDSKTKTTTKEIPRGLSTRELLDLE